MDCIWMINVFEGFCVKLIFIDFVMRMLCCLCVYDFLEICDGIMYNLIFIDIFCVKKEFKYVFFSWNVVWIRFVLDFWIYWGNWFCLLYEVVCGCYYDSILGSFSLFGYLFFYGNDEDCIYSIVVFKGRIKVMFDSFSVEGWMLVCLFDFFEVKEMWYVDYLSF